MQSDSIPAIINVDAGSAADAAQILRDAGGFDVREVKPAEVGGAVRHAIAEAPARILVAGGDGSLCTAAHELVATDIALAILPAGTLNHLAKHLELPLDLRAAATVARDGGTRTLDVGRVNGTVFLNTSSVGAYEVFVRRRERLSSRWGYHIASLIAGWEILARTPTMRVTVVANGVERTYRTPLVFVGVGERELQIPSLGRRRANGQRGLHLMIIRNRTGARLASLALLAAARGLEVVARTPAMDSVIVDRCTIEGTQRWVSIDGELIPAQPTLEYEFLPDSLTVAIAAGTRPDDLSLRSASDERER